MNELLEVYSRNLEIYDELRKDQQKLASGLTEKPVGLAQPEDHKSRPRVEEPV